MMRTFVSTLLLAFLALAAAPTQAQEAPDALVKRVAEEVLQTIRSDKDIQAEDIKDLALDMAGFISQTSKHIPRK